MKVTIGNIHTPMICSCHGYSQHLDIPRLAEPNFQRMILHLWSTVCCCREYDNVLLRSGSKRTMYNLRGNAYSRALKIVPPHGAKANLLPHHGKFYHETIWMFEMKKKYKREKKGK